MLKSSLKKHINYKRILLHVLFWTIVLAVNNFLYAYDKENYRQVFLVLLTTLPVDILATYTTIYFFIPKFLLKKRYFEFTLYFFISVVVIVLVETSINKYFSYPYILNIPIDKQPFWTINIFFLSISIYKIVVLAAVVKLIKIWYQNQYLHNKIENLNFNSEIALLKNQINPHFLFNTLNNIDSLVKKDTEKASDSIIKLSGIMRYMLYETDVEKVLLEKEIEYLTSYISLQKIRFKEERFIDFVIEGDYTKKEISPMLFVPFLENAFKHGIKEDVLPPGIIIKLIINNKNIHFEVINYCFQNRNIYKDIPRGIGLINLKRRLEILYPNKHELSTTENNGKFIAKLYLEI